MGLTALCAEMLYRLLSPFRAFVKRWGSSNLKENVWDIEFRHGQWSYPSRMNDRPLICDTIEKYLKGGVILDLGCSEGIIAATLADDSYGKYIGLDISSVAIKKAIDRTSAGKKPQGQSIEFVVGDISEFCPCCRAKVILLRQSIYYINRLEVSNVLRKYRNVLSEDGVFIVVMDNPRRHNWITSIIRNNFNVVEVSESSETIMLVFN